jgi:hypothetical protein
VRAGKLSGRSRAPSSADALDSGVSSPPRSVCRCDEYSSRIADLESRLTLSKRQAQMAINKASKSCGFMKQISILEDKVSSLTTKNCTFGGVRFLSNWYYRVCLRVAAM